MNTIRSSRVKAKKDYVCNFCNSNIFKGEKYRYDTIALDDEIYGWKGCDHCKDIVENMFEEFDYPNGATNYDFQEYLEYHGIEFKRR